MLIPWVAKWSLKSTLLLLLESHSSHVYATYIVWMSMRFLSSSIPLPSKLHTVHEHDAFSVWVVLLWVIRSSILLLRNSHTAHGNVTSCLCFFSCSLRMFNDHPLKSQFSYLYSLSFTLPNHPSVLSSVDQPLHNSWAQRYELLLQGDQLCCGWLCCFVLSISKLQMFV